MEIMIFCIVIFHSSRHIKVSKSPKWRFCLTNNFLTCSKNSFSSISMIFGNPWLSNISSTEFLSFFFLPKVTPFHRSILRNGSTVPPFHQTSTYYLLVPRISTWSNLAQSHLGAIRSTMLPLAPCW